MKKVGVFSFYLSSPPSTLPADESDVVVQAQADATEDGKDYHAFWWGVGGAAVAALPVVTVSFFGSAIPV